MKPSYKLLGVMWDHGARSNASIEDVAFEEIAPDSVEPFNLFDTIAFRRSISVSALLGMQDKEQFNELVKSLRGCEELQIVLDYEPVAGKVAEDFFRLRVSQMAAAIEAAAPHSHVRIVRPEKKFRNGAKGEGLAKLFFLVDQFREYAESRGVCFNSDGFPLLDRSSFLEDPPGCIVDFYHRRARCASDRKRTLIGNFRDDEINYRRLERVFEDLGEYRSFMGVIATDVTVTADMDVEWQKFTMLVNQLFMAVLASSGIKVVANLRCGAPETTVLLSSIPKNVMCASSFLGCDGLESDAELGYIAKILRVRPSLLLLYGKHDEIAEGQLRRMGIPFRRYDDVHTLCRNKRARAY